MAVYKTGTGTLGRVCGDLGLGDARGGTWGHQVWEAGTYGTGTRGRMGRGRGDVWDEDAGTSNIGDAEVKSEVNAISLSS